MKHEALEVWRQYCSELYEDPPHTPLRINIGGFDQEPDILRQEVEYAIHRLSNNKAAGIDAIPAEVLKNLGEEGTKAIHLLCCRIWETCKWPNDWSSSVVIPIHKKGSTSLCDNYRLIALITHASKIMLYILQTRLEPYTTWQIPQEQAGFVKGRGTREQILNIRQLIEKAREYSSISLFYRLY